jgi:hypothetical protein
MATDIVIAPPQPGLRDRNARRILILKKQRIGRFPARPRP